MSERAEEIDIVSASYDRGFEYRRLHIAFDAIWFHKRARLVTTNPDPYRPLPAGRGEPDAAAIVGAIEACTGAKCEINVGKPGPIMLETILEMLELETSECVITGDRLYTHITMALNASVPSTVVLTGQTTAEALTAESKENNPDWALDRIDRLMPPRMWEELGWTEEEG